MNLVTLLIMVIVFGLILYCVTILPLPQPFRNIALILVVLILIIVLLNATGLLAPGIVRLQ